MPILANQFMSTLFSFCHSLDKFLVTATKKGKAFVEIEEDHSEEEMDADEAEEIIL